MNPPVFAHGHLRLYLLSVLAEQPMHGYDLIQALGNRFGGTYVPSAGTIYPRLGKLEEEGLVTKTVDGRKTIYAITDAGRAELLDRESELDGIENDVTDSVRRLADEVRSSVNDAMRTLRADLASAAREARTESKAEGRSTPADESTDRVLGRLQLQQAEIIINDFRSQIRSELRAQLSSGKVTGVTVDLLRVQLDSVKDSLRASFRD
jgi:DNA-binding PadR family transcriptional regulator